MLFCPMAARPPYSTLITASTRTTGVAHCDASGNSCRQNRIIPKVPILSRMLTSSTDVPGLPCSAASGSQVCTGTIGALIANATKNPTNSHRAVFWSIGICESSESRYVGVPARADTTYSPTTEASISRPPNSEKSRNLTAA